MKVSDLVETCSLCPSQWEFRTFENRPAYARYRWGCLSISVGDVDGASSTAILGTPVYGEELGGEYDGYLEWEKVKAIVDGLPDKLPSKEKP